MVTFYKNECINENYSEKLIKYYDNCDYLKYPLLLI